MHLKLTSYSLAYLTHGSADINIQWTHHRAVSNLSGLSWLIVQPTSPQVVSKGSDGMQK